jgi:GDPmannose 4,6-dehydratase
MTKPIALITGITGQDGSYLCALLLEKGYEVHGLVRWDAPPVPAELEAAGVTLHHGDLTDALNITALIKAIQPTEIYNLAALTHVHVSFQTPSSTLDINAKGTLNILEAVRVLDMADSVQIYQASSSEMFGSSAPPQNEDTPMQPCSPYGVAKLAAYHLARIYRESYGLHVSNGILFNHESPARGQGFVTRKITRAVAAIEAGQQDALTLGNLDSIRDWGHARDYVRGMWLMLQQEKPDDYVLATGESRSVREFVERAFAGIGIDIEWEGAGTDEIGRDAASGKTLITIDPALFRPKEVNHLLGDAVKAKANLDWSPQISFDQLVDEMLEADRREILGLDEGEDEAWQKAS